jgi:hypothetical protein
VIKATLESAALLGVLVTLALLVALAFKGRQADSDLWDHQGRMERRAKQVQQDLKVMQEELDQLVQQVLRDSKEKQGLLVPPVLPAPKDQRATRETPDLQDPPARPGPIQAYLDRWRPT